MLRTVQVYYLILDDRPLGNEFIVPNVLTNEELLEHHFTLVELAKVDVYLSYVAELGLISN